MHIYRFFPNYVNTCELSLMGMEAWVVLREYQMLYFIRWLRAGDPSLPLKLQFEVLVTPLKLRESACLSPITQKHQVTPWCVFNKLNVLIYKVKHQFWPKIGNELKQYMDVYLLSKVNDTEAVLRLPQEHRIHV